MRRTLLLFIFFTSLSIYSQKEANFWFFGRNAGIDFNNNTVTSLNNGLLNTDEGCSSIADENGALLFYSDGINVWTKNHELMKYSNGSLANNLQGNPSSTQSGLIIPNPEDKNIYYIFTVGTDYVGNGSVYPVNPGFNFYTIDISKGNGGEITNGPINLSDGKDLTWSEKVTAVQGKDCTEIWILSIVQNTFYAYKVDKDGVKNTSPVTSLSSYTLKDKRGYLKASPDGTKVALADFTNDGSGRFVLYDFDNASGKITSNGLLLTDGAFDGSPYGVEFSQNSTKLYTSTYTQSSDAFNILQYDLLKANIPNTKTNVWSGTGYRGALQLGPDGRIYASVPDKTHLGGAISSQGLPPFIQSFFAPVNLINTTTNVVLNNSNQVFCIGETYEIEPEKNDPTDTYTWLKDGIEITTSRILTIDNTNFGSGLYEVKIESTSDCKKTFTGRVQITFVPKPTINNISTYIQCDFDSNPVDGFAAFNLQNLENDLVNDSTNMSFDFFETSDSSFSSPLNKVNYINSVSTSHSVLVRATNTITNCYQTATINLQVNPTGLTSYTNEHIPELDENEINLTAKFSIGSNNGIFDFSKKTQQIIFNSSGALSVTTHDFQYYRTSQDASLQTNQIFVEKLPIPQGDLNEIILCVDNPRRTPQLQTTSLNADTGTGTDTYKWFLNGVQIPGEISAIHNASASGLYKVEAYRNHPNITTPYMGYNTFRVKESNQALVIKITSADDNDIPENNKIKITIDGIGDYEYALNSTNLSDFIKGEENFSHTFTNTPPGLNAISIRDRNGCGIISSNKISTIYFQRHFTPNEDGYNDTWNVLGINNSYYTVVKVQIFNRFGKLIKEITDKNLTGWDGVYNGSTLPSNDYWV